MPGRPLNETICRICLSTIRQRPVQQAHQWIASYSTRASSRRARTRTQPQARNPRLQKPLQENLIEQLEQINVASDPTQTQPADFDVRFFEEEGGKRTELPDDGSFEQGLSGMDASDLRESLLQMKVALSTDEEREAFDQVINQMGGGWGNMRTVDDIEKMLSGQEDYTAQIDAEIERTVAELPAEMQEGFHEHFAEWMPPPKDSKFALRNPIPQIPEEPWTVNQRRKITRLNAVIQRVAKEIRRPMGLTGKHVLAVYKGYHSARRSLAHSWSSVPIDVWDFLWTVFSAPDKINKNQLAHVSLLARDMGDAKVTLSPAQQLLTIEAVFVDGWESKAIENWKRCVTTLGDEKLETFKDFWELGVRMYCRIGDLEQADRAANILLDKQSDPRILLPIIQTRAERNTAEDQESAWIAYRRMRELLGQNIKLKDYDQVVSYFLTTNQTENALYAFVDMMSDGQIDLKKLKYMPSVVANKFFLGKWLKRLIGAGDLNGAHTVVEFMRRKGVAAAPIHLNGLIGAWQRSGGADNMEKADQLAWAMIKSRIAFVDIRKAGGLASSPKSDVAPLPRATLETFCVLAENYRMRDLHDRMEELWNAFHDSEISPDAFMMNQLLESYVNAGQHKEAKSLYKALVTDRRVVPDPYTFSTLWKTLGINRLHHVDASDLGWEAAAARALFAETIKFKDIFQPDGMDGQLSRKILHTFRRLRDNTGFLVALTTLKELFGYLPPETLVMEMVLGTTKISWETPQLRRRMMIAKRDMDQELLAWADNDLANLEGTKRGVALYEYLSKMFWPKGEGEDMTSAMVDVAKEMGVYELLAPKQKGGRKKR